MTTPVVSSASQIQMDYMKLLVTQLQNQNPLEPMSNDQMAAQLTQFSQLEQLESMNSNFAKVLAATNLDYASSLIGKEVSFMGETEPGVMTLVSGTVEQVYTNVEGRTVLSTGDYTVDLAAVISVKNPV